MNTKSFGKIILLYTIAINITEANLQKTTALVELFKYGDDSNKQKEIPLNESDATAFLTSKPTGLQRTVLDLEFPEGADANTEPRFRIVQCLAVGHIDYIQKKTYKKVALKLTAKDPYTDVQSTVPACSNNIVVTLSPPGTIGATDNVLTNVYKIFQKDVTLPKNQEVTLVFEDVLDSGFLKMDLFWVNFEIKGKCSKYLQVELLQPQNTSLTGGKEITETRPQAPVVQQVQGTNGVSGAPGA